MDEISIKNESSGKFLIVSSLMDETEFEMEMIENISAKNILKPVYIYEDEKKCCSYNITGCMSFGDYISEKSFSVDDIRAILIQINNAVKCMLAYLLGEDNLLLRGDCIFVDKVSKSLKFCAYPGSSRSFSWRLGQIMESLLLSVDTEDFEAVNLCVRLYRVAADPESHMYDVINTVLDTKAIDKKDFPNQAQNHTGSSSEINTLNMAKNNISAKASTQPKSTANSKASSIFRSVATRGASKTKPSLTVEAAQTPEQVSDIIKEDQPEQGINLMDLDDLDMDAYEDDEEDGGSGHAGFGKPRNILISLIIGEGILMAAMVLLFVLRGMGTVVRMLPLYLILAVCMAIYIVVQNISRKKKSPDALAQVGEGG